MTEVRNRTVGDVLLNYREWAKTDWFKIHKCVCNTNGKGRGDEEHEIWRLEDVDKNLGDLTTKTVLEPNGGREKRIIEKELRLYKWKVEKLLGMKIKPEVRRRNTEHKDSEMEKRIMKMKCKWRDWVIIERDKNNGAMVVACPMWYRRKLMDTFDWTKWRANYQRVQLTEDQILKKWKKDNRKREKKMTWSDKGSLPYCYGIPKEKDIEKMRPIISYTHHPLRRQFNKVGRVLLFMLKKSKIESLTLWRIDDVEKELMKLNEIIKDWRKVEEIDLKMEVFDIKEMYTNLPHREIVEAVHWIIDIFQEQYGDLVTIMGNRSKDIKTGKGKYGRLVSGDEVLDTVCMDLDNAVFKCGTILAIQTIGIPMGSPMSPALAIITCARAESKMFDMLRGNAKFHAIRYIDDIWVCTLKRKDERFGNTQEILKYYDRYLKVEKEREGNQVRYLDRTISWDGKELRSIAYNKNSESLIVEGIRKFRNILPDFSYNKQKVKKAIIIGRFFRIQIGTMKPQDVFWQG